MPRRPSFPYRYSYPRPMLTVDVAPLRVQRGRLELLLIRRDKEPFPGHWALPGGFVEENEPLATAARRELWEETRLEPLLLQQVGAFGDPGRDPRGWSVTVAYLALVGPGANRAVAGDDAAAVAWHPVARLPPLAFDHEQIVAQAVETLRHRALTTAMLAVLLPPRFTWEQLGRLVAAVTGQRHDLATLRRRFQSLGLTQQRRGRAGGALVTFRLLDRGDQVY